MFGAPISSSRAAASLFAIIAFAAFMPNTARAVTISTTYTFASSTIDGFHPAASGISHDFLANATKFNPALGTLDSVGVFWSITLQATATQTSGAPGDGFGAGGGNAVSFNGQDYSGFSLSVNGTTTQLNKPVTVSDTEGAPITTLISGVNASPSVIQGAIGTGTVPVDYDYSGSFNGADTLSDVSETFSGSVEVAYNYTPSSVAVPLPKSLSMSLLGLGMLASFGLLKMAKESSASRRLA
jgi:hypothetical protein